jgi:hypothetical protein
VQTRLRRQPCPWVVPAGHSRTVVREHPERISERP